MAQVKFEIKRVNASDLKTELEAEGINVGRSIEVVEGSSLPAEGVFIDKVLEDNPNGGNKIIRLIAQDKDGKQYKCALGRVNLFGKKRLSKDDTLTENDIILRMNTKREFVYGLRSNVMNPSVPTAKHEALAFLIGKKFKATPKMAFNLLYLNEGEKFETKQQAIDSARNVDYFELSGLEEYTEK